MRCDQVARTTNVPGHARVRPTASYRPIPLNICRLKAGTALATRSTVRNARRANGLADAANRSHVVNGVTEQRHRSGVPRSHWRGAAHAYGVDGVRIGPVDKLAQCRMPPADLVVDQLLELSTADCVQALCRWKPGGTV